MRPNNPNGLETLQKTLKQAEHPVKLSHLQLTLEAGTLVTQHQALEVALKVLPAGIPSGPQMVAQPSVLTQKQTSSCS